MEYSIVIRTLGKAGTKYLTMLQCIEKLESKPKEVIVVIPKGYDLPKERLGYERFVRSEKGMVKQRCKGAEVVTSEYILFLDDDLAFPRDFVEELKKTFRRGSGRCVIPPIIGFVATREKCY
ncbi:MAG: glycosyltransferase family A protein [[Ruminococcus] torques]